MAFKLAVAALVTFAVSFKLKDDSQTRAFSFEVTAERMTSEQLTEARALNTPVVEVLTDKVRGWKGQTLVLDEATGQPAEFSREAFDVMLSAMGVPSAIFDAFADACLAKGRAKN